LFDVFLDEHCPIDDLQSVEHENPGANTQFFVKGVGSFSKGGGISNWANKPLPERGVFKN